MTILHHYIATTHMTAFNIDIFGMSILFILRLVTYAMCFCPKILSSKIYCDQHIMLVQVRSLYIRLILFVLNTATLLTPRTLYDAIIDHTPFEDNYMVCVHLICFGLILLDAAEIQTSRDMLKRLHAPYIRINDMQNYYEFAEAYEKIIRSDNQHNHHHASPYLLGWFSALLKLNQVMAMI